jgi:hypothetical protein
MQLIKIFRLLKRHLSGTRDTRGYLCRAQVPEPAIVVPTNEPYQSSYGQ